MWSGFLREIKISDGCQTGLPSYFYGPRGSSEILSKGNDGICFAYRENIRWVERNGARWIEWGDEEWYHRRVSCFRDKFLNEKD